MEEKNSTKNSSEYGRKNFPMDICKNALLEFRQDQNTSRKKKIGTFFTHIENSAKKDKVEYITLAFFIQNYSKCQLRFVLYQMVYKEIDLIIF